MLETLEKKGTYPPLMKGRLKWSSVKSQGQNREISYQLRFRKKVRMGGV
jgi:hypothetical protein